MPKLDETQFAAHVALHAGVSLEAAQRAAIASVRRLGAWLDEGTRARAAAELPARLADAIVDPHASAAQPLEACVREPEMTSGEAHELVVTVLRVFADALTEGTRDVIARALPPGVGAMLVGESIGEAPPHRAARGSSLAEGAPGSRHAVADTAPSRAQRGSIASARDPHADVKLSSARGETQERERETLADGRPPSQRPLAEKH